MTNPHKKETLFCIFFLIFLLFLTNQGNGKDTIVGAKWGLRATVNVPLSCTFSKVSFDEEQAAKVVKAKIPANPNKSFFHVFIINLFSIFINLCKYNNVLLCICQRKNELLLIKIFIFINFIVITKSKKCLFKALLSDFNDKKTIHSFE